MSERLPPIPVYLDQNVLSELQEGKNGRDRLLHRLHELKNEGVVFAYSKIHVDECRASQRPESFANIIESISAHLIEHSTPKATSVTLSRQRAADLILGELDIEEIAERRIEESLMLVQFSAGWLDDMEAKELTEFLIEGQNCLWKSLQKQVPFILRPVLWLEKRKVIKIIKGISPSKLKTQHQEWQQAFRHKLPENYAQLDEINDDEVADFLISHVDADVQNDIRSKFPHGFWSKPEDRSEGGLAGFAFMLYMMGIVRDRRVKSGSPERRIQHFRGQFRDCRHIELASRCTAFVTFDKDAARLAKAVYAYAGVQTKVILLTMANS